MTPRRSIDYRGVGQSGYTAGRAEHDVALEGEIEVRNRTYPRGADEEQLAHELETDERWTGRGGPEAPEDEEPQGEISR
jgi:hypothetical protein